MMLRRMPGRCCGGCLYWLLVIGLGLALALVVYWREAQAAPQPNDPPAPGAPPRRLLALLNDVSQSTFECDGGPGSDPDLLRLDALRLLVSYLGADSPHTGYRAAYFEFGGETRLVSPLADLGDPAARAGLVEQVSRPPEPLSWTNPLLALNRAYDLLMSYPDAAGPVAAPRAVVLLTDGEPQWANKSTEAEAIYRSGLQELMRRYAAADISLFLILLQNPDSPCSQRVAGYWQPLWQELAQSTPRGSLHLVSSPADLLPAYHAVVRDLVGATSSQTLAALVPLAAPDAAPLRVPVVVDQPLARLILTVLKEPQTTVQLLDPAGRERGDEPGIRRVDSGRELVLQVDTPALGVWAVQVAGPGAVSVFQDQAPQPTATPLPTSTASPTATATWTATPRATSTATPSPSATATALPSATHAPSATATPAPAAVPSPPSPHAGARLRTVALWAAGALLGLVALGAGLLRVSPAGRAPAHARTIPGELRLEAGPDLTHDALLPYDLARTRRRGLTIGRGAAKTLWRLPAWGGWFTLQAAREGARLQPQTGDLQINGQPVTQDQGAVLLRDQDEIVCGPYRIRYSCDRALIF